MLPFNYHLIVKQETAHRIFVPLVSVYMISSWFTIASNPIAYPNVSIYALEKAGIAKRQVKKVAIGQGWVLNTLHYFI